MSKLIDETGNTHKRLTVIKRGYNDNHGLAQWWCRCECGNTTLVRGLSLRLGHTKSCGCLQREVAREHMREVGKAHGGDQISTPSTTKTAPHLSFPRRRINHRGDRPANGPETPVDGPRKAPD